MAWLPPAPPPAPMLSSFYYYAECNASPTVEILEQIYIAITIRALTLHWEETNCETE